MDQEVFRKVLPREYLKRYLVNNVRRDGRSPITPRTLKITTGSIRTAVGSAMIKLGRTTTVAGLDAVLVEPSPSAPDQGILEISVDLLSIASATSRLNRADYATVLTEYLRSLITPHLDLSTLCVEPGKLVWSLHLSVYCIDNDGNLEDAMLVAAVAALQNVLLPSVRMIDDLEPVDDENKKGNDSQLRSSTDGEQHGSLAVATTERNMPLEIESFPLSVSFTLFEEKTLIDPSGEEESVGDSRVTFVMKPSGELRAVLKPGGKHISQAMYKSCLSQAVERVPHLVAKLAEASKTQCEPV